MLSAKLSPSLLFVPLLLLKRYFSSVKEIKKLKEVNSSLQPIHLGKTSVLVNRKMLLQKMEKGSVCAEIGVASGDFSTQILDICEPSKLHLIDYWAANKAGHGVNPIEFAKRMLLGSKSCWDIVNQKFGSEIEKKKVELHRGFSWDMMEGFEDNYFDFVYIDAGHDYSSVAKDLAVAKRKVKDGGIIAGHDYVLWGRFGYKCGVVEAVNEFCIQNNYEILYVTAETRTPASFAIRKLPVD